MPKKLNPLVALKLETCHANSDGTAWYAYFRGDVDVEACKHTQDRLALGKRA